jgi:hypothetical protein
MPICQNTVMLLVLYQQIKIQWALLSGIMDNRINWLKGSNLSRITSPKLLFYTYCTLKLIQLLVLVGYWNQIPLSSFHSKNKSTGSAD